MWWKLWSDPKAPIVPEARKAPLDAHCCNRILELLQHQLFVYFLCYDSDKSLERNPGIIEAAFAPFPALATDTATNRFLKEDEWAHFELLSNPAGFSPRPSGSFDCVDKRVKEVFHTMDRKSALQRMMSEIAFLSESSWIDWHNQIVGVLNKLSPIYKRRFPGSPIDPIPKAIGRVEELVTPSQRLRVGSSMW